jgi:hypothetical protein
MKLGAIVSGLVAGGFLFFQYSRLSTHNFWELTWYEAALLLVGLGLAGLFPSAWVGAVLSTAAAAFLGVGFQIYSDLSRNPKCCNLWPLAFVMWLFLGIPAPLFGGVIGYLISARRVSRLFFLSLLAAGVGIGLGLPLIQHNVYRPIEPKRSSLRPSASARKANVESIVKVPTESDRLGSQGASALCCRQRRSRISNHTGGPGSGYAPTDFAA